MFELPVPPEADQAASLALAERLIDRCAEAGGTISFAEYMATVLYDADHGYYGAGRVAFGAGGDFVTAPERSPAFSEAVGHEVAAAFAQGVTPRLIEFGAGSGRLAADLLANLDARGALPEEYWIVEVSEPLRERQRRTLSALPERLSSRVHWCDEDALFAGPVCGIVLANELLDAMPVHRLVWSETPGVQGWQEQRVAWDGTRFVYKRVPAADSLREAAERMTDQAGRAPLPGQIIEINLQMIDWLERLGQAACEAGLAVMLFDYGATAAELMHPQRRDGMLRCHYRHLAHDDPFVYPGLQDITSWVDFSAVAQAARSSSFSVDVYTSQAAFVMATDAPARLEQAMQACSDRAELARLAQGFKELVLPTEMGERFRALLLSKGRPVDWPSGAGRNERARLLQAA
ncbi:MAG: class I SAM-dependent methyltransferase [Halothiobacillaceae bacterium]